jgi:hypothetical protein
LFRTRQEQQPQIQPYTKNPNYFHSNDQSQHPVCEIALFSCTCDFVDFVKHGASPPRLKDDPASATMQLSSTYSKMFACVNATRTPVRIATRATIGPICAPILVGAKFSGNDAACPSRHVRAWAAPAISLEILKQWKKGDFCKALEAAGILFKTKELKPALAVSCHLIVAALQQAAWPKPAPGARPSPHTGAHCARQRDSSNPGRGAIDIAAIKASTLHQTASAISLALYDAHAIHF